MYCLFEKTENEQKRGGVGPFLKRIGQHFDRPTHHHLSGLKLSWSFQKNIFRIFFIWSYRFVARFSAYRHEHVLDFCVNICIIWIWQFSVIIMQSQSHSIPSPGRKIISKTIEVKMHCKSLCFWHQWQSVQCVHFLWFFLS